VQGVFACVGWRVALCDPMWQVIPRSSVTGFPLKNLMLNQCFNFFWQCCT